MEKPVAILGRTCIGEFSSIYTDYFILIGPFDTRIEADS